jgi:arylsulfatase A-like enzyme
MVNSKQIPPPSDYAERDVQPFWRSKCSWWATAVLLALLPCLGLATRVAKAQAPDTRPNIVLLVADDAGYSDFGPFGGDAKTPTIDAFAAAGTKLTNYHNMPTCSPSRSVFLTGVTNHLNGFGTMSGNLTHNPLDAQTGQTGYQAYLTERTVTVPTLLKAAGYHTYHVGKWHLAQEEEVDGQDIFARGAWPIDKGFEKSYGMLDGGGEHFGSCESRRGVYQFC